ncbi:MAG: S8 family serine peptidase [Desulfobacterales bacterium]|nr:S8 family serine peptidase [Desulfobacterales bacterium]
MKKKFWKVMALVFVMMLIHQVGNAKSTVKGSPGSEEAGIYIIRLADSPLATYKGGIAGMSATSPRSTGKKRLNVRTSASRRYRKYLSDKQDQLAVSMNRTAGRRIEPIYKYSVVCNGMAVKLTPAEAAKIRRLPNVVSVKKDKLRKPMTNAVPGFVNATAIWDGTGTGGLPGTKGEGVIVGVIDSGIWPEHPSFADDGSYPAPPAKWAGECTPPADDSAAYTCNNKLIGVQYFIDGYIASDGGEYDGLFNSGRDDDGHGTHTASTAAGNENIPAGIYNIDRGQVSGMAPRAHVASYKGLGPNGGATSDLVAAIDKAVADGVDVINYSVGSDTASDPWTGEDALAFLAAREAGVFVATSAGNDGPGVSTMGSPANAPWVTSVGASYFNRLYLSDITLEGPGTLPTGLFGATSTPGVSNFRLVEAEGIEDVAGDTSGHCESPFPPGTFQAEDVVLCKRTKLGYVQGSFVQEAGAGAVIHYNVEDNYDYNSYAHPIPTVVVLNETGLAIKEYLAQNPGQVFVSFTQGNPVSDPDPRIPTDTVVGFSSRGPNINEDNNTLINVIKPDVTAPGIHILAGASPEHIAFEGEYSGNYGQQGEFFQVIQGTSMSSPVVAGLGALLKALYPEWTPTQIQSALMSTAVTQGQMARDEDSDDPADPFDIGGGRADVSRAARAGFVLDETVENYMAADPSQGGDPSALNLPSLADAECLHDCSWSRTLQSNMDTPVTWTVSLTGQGAASLTADPMSFTLPPNGEQVVTVTAHTGNLDFDEWVFAEIRFTPDSTNTVEAHFPVAIRPVAGKSPVVSVDIETRRNQGTYTVEGVRSIETGSLTAKVYVGEPEITQASIPEDSNTGSAYDDLEDGVFIKLFDVPATTKGLAVEITESASPDMDMFVGIDENGDGLPDEDEEICSSAGASWDEFCSFPEPGEELESGAYWVIVQNFQTSGEPEDNFTLSIAIVNETSTGTSVSVTAPTDAALNEPFDIEVSWDIPDLQNGDRRFGLLEVGVDAANPSNIISAPINLTRMEDDVVFKSDIPEDVSVYPGDTVTYTMRIQPELIQTDAVTYTLANTLPDGMTYVSGSASVEPDSVDGNQLTWTLEDISGDYRYKMTTSLDNPFCGDLYLNLEDYGYLAEPDISGNGIAISFEEYNPGDPVNFFGEDYPDGLYITDDGFITLDPVTGDDPGANTDIPDPAVPNNIIAPLWRDLEIVYDQEANRGVTMYGSDEFMIIEYDDVEPAPAGSTDERFDFQIQMTRTIDDSAGAYEIVFAYDNLNGSLSPGTIGVENADGTKGVAFAYNDAEFEDGFSICFDCDNAIDITYQATVNDDVVVPAEMVNAVEHTIPESQPATAESAINVIEAILGDVSQDGKVDIHDALAVAQYDVGLAELPGFAMADVDGNGIVNIFDALRIAEYIIGVIPSLDG